MQLGPELPELAVCPMLQLQEVRHREALVAGTDVCGGLMWGTDVGSGCGGWRRLVCARVMHLGLNVHACHVDGTGMQWRGNISHDPGHPSKQVPCR